MGDMHACTECSLVLPDYDVPDVHDCTPDENDNSHVLPEDNKGDVGDVHDSPSAQLVAEGPKHQGVENHAQTCSTIGIPSV